MHKTADWIWLVRLNKNQKRCCKRCVDVGNSDFLGISVSVNGEITSVNTIETNSKNSGIHDLA